MMFFGEHLSSGVVAVHCGRQARTGGALTSGVDRPGNRIVTMLAKNIRIYGS